MLDEAGGGLKPADRPDIVNRVFMIKLKELMRDIKEKKHFGETLASKCNQISIFTLMHIKFLIFVKYYTNAN